MLRLAVYSGVLTTLFTQLPCVSHEAVDDSIIAHAEVQGSVLVSSGGGCIRRSLRDVWSIFHTPSIMRLDEKRIDFFKIRKVITNNDNTAYIYESTYEVHHPMSPHAIEWKVEWRHKIIEGDTKNPKEVVITYKKMPHGTRFINLFEGSYHLKAIDTNSTAFWTIEQLRAAQMNHEEAEERIKVLVHQLRTERAVLDVFDP